MPYFTACMIELKHEKTVNAFDMLHAFCLQHTG